jgi:hypothetical protein
MDGQMAERPMASDCKSDGLSPTGVRIPLCPLLQFFSARVKKSGRQGGGALKELCVVCRGAVHSICIYDLNLCSEEALNWVWQAIKTSEEKST